MHSEVNQSLSDWKFLNLPIFLKSWTYTHKSLEHNWKNDSIIKSSVFPWENREGLANVNKYFLKKIPIYRLISLHKKRHGNILWVFTLMSQMLPLYLLESTSSDCNKIEQCECSLRRCNYSAMHQSINTLMCSVC